MEKIIAIVICVFSWVEAVYASESYTCFNNPCDWYQQNCPHKDFYSESHPWFILNINPQASASLNFRNRSNDLFENKVDLLFITPQAGSNNEKYRGEIHETVDCTKSGCDESYEIIDWYSISIKRDDIPNFPELSPDRYILALFTFWDDAAFEASTGSVICRKL